MKIGVSTSCFYPLETEVSLENLGKAGIRHTEIFFNALSELKQSFVDMLLDIQNEYGKTDIQIDLFNEIDNAYNGEESLKTCLDKAIEILGMVRLTFIKTMRSFD